MTTTEMPRISGCQRWRAGWRGSASQAPDVGDEGGQLLGVVVRAERRHPAASTAPAGRTCLPARAGPGRRPGCPRRSGTAAPPRRPSGSDRALRRRTPAGCRRTSRWCGSGRTSTRPSPGSRLKMASPSLLALPSASAVSMAFWISSCFALGSGPPSHRFDAARAGLRRQLDRLQVGDDRIDLLVVHRAAAGDAPRGHRRELAAVDDDVPDLVLAEAVAAPCSAPGRST